MFDDVRAFLEVIALHSRTLCMTRELHGPVSKIPREFFQCHLQSPSSDTYIQPIKKKTSIHN